MAFKRRVEIIIGQEGETGLSISELFIKFEVHKSDAESMNSATVDLYNINSETHDKIAKAKNKLIINAGYEDEGISSLFFGTIIRTSIKKEGADKILTIEAQDGEKVYSRKKTALSYKAGTKAITVLDSIFTILGLPVSGKENINKSIEFTIGYSFIGMAKTALAEVLAHCKCSFTIQNEWIIIISEGGTIQETGMLLNAESGLISIDPADDTQNKASKKNAKKYIIKTLLFPQLIPASKCKVQSKIKNIDAFFKVRSGKYYGDNRGGDFFDELEVDIV